MTERKGIPLVTTLSGANVPDGKRVLATIDAIPKVQGRRGRARQRPDKLHADKASDDQDLRRELRRRGITPRIARRNVESSTTLGRHRWVVERTLAWQQGFRRLRIRDEKRDDIYQAFCHLADALICWGRINGHYC